MTLQVRAVLELAFVVAVVVIQLTPVHGEQDVLIEGCPGSYVYLQCSDDETIKVKDIVLSQGDSTGGAPCPENDVPGPVPEEMSHLIESADQRYEEGFCEDDSECAFYIARQDLGGNVNDQVITITYECAAGSGRKAGMIVLVIVGVVAFIVFIALIAVLIRHHWSEEEEDYSAFANVSRSSSVTTLERQRAASSKNGAPAAAAAAAAPAAADGGGDTKDAGEPADAQHVSVTLEVPPNNNNNEPSVQYTKA